MSNTYKIIVLTISCLVATSTIPTSAFASTGVRDEQSVGTDRRSKSKKSEVNERELVAAAEEGCSALSNSVPTTFMGAGRAIGAPVPVGTSARARCVHKRLRAARRIGATRSSLDRNE